MMDDPVTRRDERVQQATVAISRNDGTLLLTFDAPSGDVTIHEPDSMTEAAVLFWRAVQYIAETTPTPAVMAIVEKRRRQVDVHGYTQEHDRQDHQPGEFARAGACLADLGAALLEGAEPEEGADGVHVFWPWDQESWERASSGGLHEVLVNAAALIAAELDNTSLMPIPPSAG